MSRPKVYSPSGLAKLDPEDWRPASVAESTIMLHIMVATVAVQCEEARRAALLKLRQSEIAVHIALLGWMVPAIWINDMLVSWGIVGIGLGMFTVIEVANGRQRRAILGAGIPQILRDSGVPMDMRDTLRCAAANADRYVPAQETRAR